MNLSNIPTWVWITGGGIVVVGAVMLTRGRSPSSNAGQSSPFTDTLSQLMTALSNLQGSLPRGGTAPNGGGGPGPGGGPGGSNGQNGTPTPTTPNVNIGNWIENERNLPSTPRGPNAHKGAIPPTGLLRGILNPTPSGNLAPTNITAAPVIQAPSVALGFGVGAKPATPSRGGYMGTGVSRETLAARNAVKSMPFTSPALRSETAQIAATRTQAPRPQIVATPPKPIAAIPKSLPAKPRASQARII